MSLNLLKSLNIVDADVERLAREVASLTGESETEAIRMALEERRARIVQPNDRRRMRILRFLQEEVWPLVPPNERGRRLRKDEEDALLGYGAEGV